jgi:hypothetical protein
MHEVMVEDPRRRFVFAFTIENTVMRVWMASRSDILVSQPFNFITVCRKIFHNINVSLIFLAQDHCKFIYFVLSQMYADESQLGLDPTITAVQDLPDAIDPEKLCYDYKVRVVTKSTEQITEKVEEHVYRTDYLINYDGAQSLRGRGTRVWKVHRLVDGEADGNQSGVLKDFWVDEDRLPEGQILTAIVEQPDIDEETRNILKDMFLTPVVSGDVYIGGERDGTRTLIRRGADIPDDSHIFPTQVPNSHQPSHKLTTRDVNITKSSVDETAQDMKIIRYFSKYHHRIVFAEERKPLSQVESLYDVFSALIFVVTGRPQLIKSGSLV